MLNQQGTIQQNHKATSYERYCRYRYGQPIFLTDRQMSAAALKPAKLPATEPPSQGISVNQPQSPASFHGTTPLTL